MTAMAAQVPALFEALSGMQMSELLSKVRLIGEKPSVATSRTVVEASEPAIIAPSMPVADKRPTT
jgi:hypothetical protein